MSQRKKCNNKMEGSKSSWFSNNKTAYLEETKNIRLRLLEWMRILRTYLDKFTKMYFQETHCTIQQVAKSSIQSKSLLIKDWLNKILSYHGIHACLKCNGAELILSKNILAFLEISDDFAISMYILL